MDKVKLRKQFNASVDSRVGVCLKPFINVNIHSTSIHTYQYLAIITQLSIYQANFAHQQSWQSQATFRQDQGVVESLEGRAQTETGQYASCLVDDGLIV